MAKSANYNGTMVSDECFEGDYLPDTSKPISPEKDLWQSVLLTAWNDAFLASNWWLQQTEGKASNPEALRGEARRFLTSNIQPWQSDREEVCDRADVDPDMLRAAALKRLELARVEDVARREGELAALDRAFENLMAREDRMKKGEVTRAMRHLAVREANI